MRILIVEDDLLIAASLAAFVAESGHAVAAIVADAAGAAASLGGADLAFIDIRLADGVTGFRIAAEAEAAGVPFVFTTANFRLAMGDFAGAIGMIAKPYDAPCIAVALEYLERITAGAEAGPPPPGLVLSLPWIERLGLSVGPGAEEVATGPAGSRWTKDGGQLTGLRSAS